MNVNLLRGEGSAAELGPGAQREERNVVVGVDSLPAQTREDGVCATANGAVLALENETDRGRLGLVNRMGVARQQGDNNTRLPLCAFLVSTNNALHEGITNAVLDWRGVDNSGCNEELILDIDEVFRQLNGWMISFDLLLPNLHFT